MKILFGLLCLSVFSFGAPQTTDAQTLLTFDTLAPGNSYIPIPNGYGGLQWSGFGVINGAIQQVTSGYYTGMVSPDNVAFNYDEFDRNASISSSSTPFNFDSAYLTAAFAAGLQVEVQGFIGTNLTYNNTYTMNDSSPSFINFDYMGVDEVKFLVGSDADIFVMDNALISAVPEPDIRALLAVGAAMAGAGALRKTQEVQNL